MKDELPYEDSDMFTKMQAMMERARLEDIERQAFLASLDEALKSKPCCNHPEHRLPLNAERLFKSQSGEWLLEYLPCDQCAEDEQLKAAGVPSVLFRASFDNWRPRTEAEQRIKDRCIDFQKLKRGFLVLTGGFGTGKSHLAVAILRGYRRPLFTTQRSFLYAFRKRYQDHDDSPDIVVQCQQASCLVLDDIDAGTGSRDEMPAILETLDSRYCAKLPTILTTNLSAGRLMDVLGDRMKDRLTECAVVLQFDGQSHRRGKRDDYLTA
jgi:DNA replication protein DnaC